MVRAQTVICLIFAFTSVCFICFAYRPVQAQECVQWSTFSCTDKKPVTAPAAQQEGAIRLGIISPKDAVELDVRKLYRVDATCNSTRILPAPREGIFNRADVVTTHVIAVTNKALTGDALPTDAKVLIPVYSVGTAKANQSDFTNKACNQSFFISGRDPLFIAATANQTRTNTPSTISNLLYDGLKLFNPIAPLFAGATAVAALQPVLAGISATQDPLKQMFSHFDAKGTQTYSSQLYVGETNIRTPYSRTTVTVKEVPSVIKTENGRFIVSYEDTLKGYSDEVRVPALDVKAVAADCRSYGGQLVSKNFPAYDVAYGISFVTQTAGLDTEKAVACLGKQYGLLSVEKFTCPEPGTGLECLWNRFNQNPLTAQNFEDSVPPQKYEASFFKSLQNTMTDYASAIAKGAEPPRADLAKHFQDSVELEDFERLVEGKDGQLSPAELMQQLVESGFTKFGCQGKDTQAAGMLFGFPDKAKSDDLYHSEDVVALRTWQAKSLKPGEPGKVFKVEALFQPGLVEAAAKPTLMWCGRGVHLAATPEPEKQEPKKEESGGASK
jgi:hypothetical protein